MLADYNQLRRLCFRQQVASGTTKRRKSDCPTAAKNKTVTEQRSPLGGRGQGAQPAAAAASSNLSEKSSTLTEIPNASFKPVICAVTGETVGLKDLSTESKTPLLGELTTSNNALSPIAAVETAQGGFSAVIYLLLPPPHPIRRYPPPKRPSQLVSPATQLAQRLVAVAAVARANTHTRAHAHMHVPTLAPSARVSPTQPTQTPMTRSVTSPFSLCAEFSLRSTNYSTHPKRRSKRLLRPQNEYLSKCGYIPSFTLTSHIPASERSTLLIVSVSHSQLPLSRRPLSPSSFTFPPVSSVSIRINVRNIHSEPLTFVLSGVLGLVDKLFNST